MMKNLFLMAAFMLCSALTVNAQEVSLVNNNEEAAPAAEAVQAEQAAPALMPAWVELSSANASAIAQSTSSDAYHTGKVLKTVGMVTTFVGGAAAIALFAKAAKDSNDDNPSVGTVVDEGVSIWYGIIASGVAVSGAILWAVGAHKMKVNKDGNLAFTF